jgi:hypothetical protein
VAQFVEVGGGKWVNVEAIAYVTVSEDGKRAVVLYIGGASEPLKEAQGKALLNFSRAYGTGEVTRPAGLAGRSAGHTKAPAPGGEQQHTAAPGDDTVDALEAIRTRLLAIAADATARHPQGGASRRLLRSLPGRHRRRLRLRPAGR